MFENAVERELYKQPKQDENVGYAAEDVAPRYVIASHVVKLGEVFFIYIQHRHHSADSFQIRPDEQHFTEQFLFVKHIITQ